MKKTGIRSFVSNSFKLVFLRILSAHSFVFTLVCLLFFNTAFAHIDGNAEITYKWLSSGKYEFTIKGRNHCGGVPLSQSSLVARSITGGKLLVISNQTLLSVTDVSGISPNCPNQSNCAGGTSPYGFEEYVWIAEGDFSSFSECEWTVSWEQCCRDGNITTGQSGENYFTFVMLNQCVQNSSPTFEESPLRYVCYHGDVSGNNGVVDRRDNADSFTYHLVAAKSGLTTNVSYHGSFSPTRPLRFLGFPNPNLPAPAGFYLDSMTGAMRFRPTTLNERATICLEVREWRRINGVRTLIGIIRRDMIVLVINCGRTPNTDPSIQTVSRNQEVCIKDSFCFDILTTDADASDTTFIYWDSTVQGAQFFTNNGQVRNATGTFCWKPGNTAVSDTPYYFAVSVYDNKCPFSGHYSTTFRVFVRDSTDGPSVDIGPDISDSTGLDSVLVHGNLDDYSGQSLLWTSSGDGLFAFSDSVTSYYYPGPQDKKACSYSLMLQIADATPCLGNSKLADTLQVFHQLKQINAGADQSFLVNDTLLLAPLVDTSRAWSYHWLPNSRVWIENDTLLQSKIVPSDSAIFDCGFAMILAAYGCDTLYDSVHFARIFIPVNAGANQTILQADSIVLDAVLGYPTQRGYWRSNGQGILLDSLNPQSAYYFTPSDFAACSLRFVWQELPAAACFVNADTIDISTVFTGLNAGPDQTISLQDSALLNAMPKIGAGTSGQWSSLGDGYFTASNNPQTHYKPGVNDKNACGVSLIWRYPYPQCSAEEDTLFLGFQYSGSNAGNDQILLFGDSLFLDGSHTVPGSIPNYWTSLGDGQLKDSLDPNSAYYPGPNEWENCGGALVLHAPYPQCGGGTDTMNWTMASFTLNAGLDVVTSADSFSISAAPIQTGRIQGWWSTLGDGYFADSLAFGTHYFMGPQDLQACGGSLLWNAPYFRCGEQRDTLHWKKTVIPVNAGVDQTRNIGEEIVLQGKSNAQRVRWETNGLGRFLDSSAKATVYYPNEADYPLCSLNFTLSELEQQCGLGTDELLVVWQEEGIELEGLTYDACFMDSFAFVLQGNKDLSLLWTTNGTGTFSYDSSQQKWYYLPDPEDYNLGEILFTLDAKGYCLQVRDSLAFTLFQKDHWKAQANASGPVTVYPNPTRNWVTIDGDCDLDVVSVAVYDVLGQKLQSWPIQQLPFVLSMESLIPGTYLLRIELKNGRIEIVPVTKFE